jgi:phosphotransferase system IIA component
MSQVFTKLRLNSPLLPASDLKVFSPLDAQVQLPDAQSYLAAQHGLLGETLQLIPQGTALLAPLQGTCHRIDYAGSLISFRHQNGLRVDLCFQTPDNTGCEGIHFLLPAQSQVQAGQKLAELDLAKLQRYGKASCLVSIQPAQAVKAIYARTGFVNAGTDVLCTLELHSPDR